MIRKLQHILLMTALMAACTLNEPRLPAWDTEWKFYLPTVDYIMSKTVDNDSLLFADTTANIPIIKVSINDTSDWERISDDDLVFDVPDERYNATMDQFSLTKPADVATPNKNVLDIIPAELLVAGDTLLPYGDITVQNLSSELEFDHFHRADISEGNIWLTYHNLMFLTLRPGLTIKIFDNSGWNGLIDVITFDKKILPNETVISEKINLAGKSISNKFRLEYEIPIEASGQMRVLSDADKAGFFYSALSMDELKVSYAEAEIPEQHVVKQESIDLSQQGHKLIKATIKKGMAHIYLTNHLPLNSKVRFELLNFQKNGQPKIFERRIVSGAQTIEHIDFSGWEILNPQNPAAIMDVISYSMIADVDSSLGIIPLHATDSISANIVIDSLYFSSVQGIIDTVEKDIETKVNDDLDFFKDIEGRIRFNDLNMILSFETEFDLPITVRLKIAGYRKNDVTKQVTDSVIINLERNIQPLSISPVTEIVLDKNTTSPSIVDLLEILPNEIAVSGSALVAGQGSVQAGNGIRVVYEITSPLSLEIKNPIVYEAEVDTMEQEDIDQDIRDALSDDTHQAEAELILKNGLPVGAEVKVILADERQALFTDIIADSSKKIMLSGIVNAGSVDATGYVNSPVSSTVRIDLSEQELDIFRRAPLYLREIVTVQPSSGHVRIRQTDKIDVDAMIHVKVRVNK